MPIGLLTRARQIVGLSKAELARRSETSRSTVSAYEHGRVSPTLETFERLLAVAGHRLNIEAEPAWHAVEIGRGRVAEVPDVLWRLPVDRATATVMLPLHLEWSRASRIVDLSDRRQRLRAYETILREGRPQDIERFVDGPLLVDGWDEMTLPVAIREAWQPAIDLARGHD